MKFFNNKEDKDLQFFSGISRRYEYEQREQARKEKRRGMIASGAALILILTLFLMIMFNTGSKAEDVETVTRPVVCDTLFLEDMGIYPTIEVPVYTPQESDPLFSEKLTERDPDYPYPTPPVPPTVSPRQH